MSSASLWAFRLYATCTFGIVHGLSMFIQEYNEVVFSGLNEACLLLPALLRSAQKPTLPGKELFNTPRTPPLRVQNVNLFSLIEKLQKIILTNM